MPVRTTCGAATDTLSAAGHAVELVPEVAGAVLVAEFAVSVTVSVSALPPESVTVKLSVPGAGFTVTCGEFAPLTMMPAGDAVHA